MTFSFDQKNERQLDPSAVMLINLMAGIMDKVAGISQAPGKHVLKYFSVNLGTVWNQHHG